MLATDKQLLLTELKRNTTSLKQKEFNLHHENLMTVGTQAAVLAGLDVVMFVEFEPPPPTSWGEFVLIARALHFFYYIAIISAFCANMTVVAHTTSLSVLASGLALRGPDGSMIAATDALFEERKSVYPVFRIGLAATVGSVVLGVWLILHWEAAICCSLVALYTCTVLYRKYYYFRRRFKFDKHETVDFTDIFEGPAAIKTVPMHMKGRNGMYHRGSIEKRENDNRSVEMMENGTTSLSSHSFISQLK